jgi:hypothetical protein
MKSWVFHRRTIQIDFPADRVRLLKNNDLNLASGEVLPIKMCNDAFSVTVRIANHPARWTRLDTGRDAALEWMASETQKKRMDQVSIGLSDASVRYIETSV